MWCTPGDVEDVGEVAEVIELLTDDSVAEVLPSKSDIDDRQILFGKEQTPATMNSVEEKMPDNQLSESNFHQIEDCEYRDYNCRLQVTITGSVLNESCLQAFGLGQANHQCQRFCLLFVSK